jgi:voltage-gated potassium channel
MTADPYEDLPAATRRRTVLRAVLGGFLSTTFLVVLYYVLPLDRPLDTSAVVRVLIGLAVFALIMV